MYHVSDKNILTVSLTRELQIVYVILRLICTTKIIQYFYFPEEFHLYFGYWDPKGHYG